MSDLTERIAAAHEPQLIEGSWSEYYDCSCGTWSSLDSHDEGTGSLAAHVAEVTEAAIRAQLAAEIEALKFNPGGIRLFIQMGGTVAWTEGWDDALTTVAETIRGDLAPTPCDCGIECACATDRKDAP